MMIKPRKLLSYSLSSILVCSLLSSVGFASHKKKKDTATTNSTQTTAATQPTAKTASETSSKSKRASRKSKKEKEAAETSTASTPAPTPAAKNEQPKTSHKTKSAMTSTASASDIANAKAKGMVWVNTESKVYHSSGRYYGNTKHGQFMSQAEAQKAGYKAAKR